MCRNPAGNASAKGGSAVVSTCDSGANRSSVWISLLIPTASVQVSAVFPATSATVSRAYLSPHHPLHNLSQARLERSGFTTKPGATPAMFPPARARRQRRGSSRCHPPATRAAHCTPSTVSASYHQDIVPMTPLPSPLFSITSLSTFTLPRRSRARTRFCGSPARTQAHSQLCRTGVCPSSPICKVTSRPGSATVFRTYPVVRPSSRRRTRSAVGSDAVALRRDRLMALLPDRRRTQP